MLSVIVTVLGVVELGSDGNTELSINTVLPAEYLIHTTLDFPVEGVCSTICSKAKNISSSITEVAMEGSGMTRTMSSISQDRLCHIRCFPTSFVKNVIVSKDDIDVELRHFNKGVDNPLIPQQCVHYKSGWSVLIVDLTSTMCGRDMESLVYLSRKHKTHIISVTCPDDYMCGSDEAAAYLECGNKEGVIDKTLQHYDVQDCLNDVQTSKQVDEMVLRMMAEIQVGIACSSHMSKTDNCLAGAIGPLYLRYTSSNAFRLDIRDVRRIQAAALTSLRFCGVPLLFFWNSVHPNVLLTAVLHLLETTGGSAVVSKTAIFNPFVHISLTSKKTKPSVVQPPLATFSGYDISGIFEVLHAGAYVGFTCNGGIDSVFNSHLLRLDAGHNMIFNNGCIDGNNNVYSFTDVIQQFWVGKTPVSSSTDLVEILLHIASVHPPKSIWKCEQLSSGKDECNCLQSIRCKMILTNGMSFRINLRNYGGFGLSEARIVDELLRHRLKIEGLDNTTSPINLHNNSIDFLRFEWKPAEVQPHGGIIPILQCYWCGNEIGTSLDNVFHKFDFTYCSIVCLSGHRKAEFILQA